MDYGKDVFNNMELLSSFKEGESISSFDNRDSINDDLLNDTTANADFTFPSFREGEYIPSFDNRDSIIGESSNEPPIDSDTSNKEQFLDCIKDFTLATELPSLDLVIVGKEEKNDPVKLLWETILSGKKCLPQKPNKDKIISDIVDFIVKNKFFIIYKSQLHYYTGSYWEPIEQNEACRQIDEILYSNNSDLHSAAKLIKYDTVYNKLLQISILVLHDNTIPDHSNDINFEDCVYNVITRKFRDNKAEDYFFDCIDISRSEIIFGTSNYANDFINNICQDDTDLETKIYELIGTIISPYALKKLWYIFGVADSGKTTFCLWLSNLIGLRNTKNFDSLERICSTYSGGDIDGKKLVICNDLEDKKITPTQIKRLKQLSGRDIDYVEKKYKPSTSSQFRGQILLCSNFNLKIDNIQKEQAFISRIEYLPFVNPVLQKDPNIIAKLNNDKGYIINKALQKLSDLVDNNFSYTEVDVPNMDMSISEVYSIESFLNEMVVINSNFFTATQELYSYYSNIQGAKVLSMDTFSIKLHDTILKDYKIKKNGRRGYQCKIKEEN